MNKIKLTIIGGDNRYSILKKLLENDGYTVSSYGNMYIDASSTLSSSLSGSKAVICPIPFTKDNVNINLSSNFPLSIDSLFSMMGENNINLLTAGVLSPDITKKALNSSIYAYDIFSSEETALYNAVPTAEGAIMTAISESDRVLFKSRILVIGFGRCGKVLSSMLNGMGANVTATYRKKEDKALIYTFGITAINIKDMALSLSDFDFIFNTAPAKVLTSDNMKNIKKNTLIIDIAQAPGGVDYSAARDLGLKALYCPGLPGRVAPYTAACVIHSAIYDILSEHQL